MAASASAVSSVSSNANLGDVDPEIFGELRVFSFFRFCVRFSLRSAD